MVQCMYIGSTEGTHNNGNSQATGNPQNVKSGIHEHPGDSLYYRILNLNIVPLGLIIPYIDRYPQADRYRLNLHRNPPTVLQVLCRTA